jgi:hypothetical protein
MLGHDDRGRDPELSRDPGDALAHVPGSRSDDAVAQLLGRDLKHGVRGAAELERADRLEVLELEVDLAVVLEADERRAKDAPGEPVAGSLDLGQRDQNGTAVPTPWAWAAS